MKQINEVAAMPGATTGATISRRVRISAEELPVSRQRQGSEYRGRVGGRVGLAVEGRQKHPGDGDDEEDADQPGEDADGEGAAGLAIGSGCPARGARGGNGPDVGDA